VGQIRFYWMSNMETGAFMQTLEDAKKLAQTMIDIGKHCYKDTRATISSMSQPLGKAIGNSLEVIEAIETLKGKWASRFRRIMFKSRKYKCLITSKTLSK